MQIIASYIQLTAIYNSTIHISACILFFLKLKFAWIKIFFPYFSLTFPDPLTNSLISLEWKPCPCWWKFQGQKQRPIRG